MRRSLFKDVYREIINTRGRFLGILAIVSLGVAFYTGLGATGFDMKITGDRYLTERRLMDIRVVGTYGLNDNDIKAIRAVPGVESLYPSYSMDAQTEYNGQTVNMKVHAYDPETGMNQPLPVNGALPYAAGDCVVEERFLRYFNLSVGDRVTLQSGKDSDIRNQLRNRTYEITGTVKSPLYISEERGASSIGRGETDFYMYIPQANFINSGVYTEAYILVEGVSGLMCFSDEYKDKVEAVADLIEDAGEIRAGERAREMTAAAYANLRASETALEENRAETRRLTDENAAALAEATGTITSSYTDITGSLTDIFMQEYALDQQLAQVTSSLVALRDAEALLDAQEQDLYAARREVMDNEPYLGAEFSVQMSDIDDGLAEISDGRFALSQNKKTLYESFNRLTEGKEQLYDALGSAYGGTGTLAGAGYGITEQTAELAAERARLLARLDAATEDLEKAREDLDDLDDPEWYVLDREGNPGYASYADDTDKITAIGRVFPLIFFLVAALVCLTSMTRLVEERRTEIGTLKSLGYSGGWIVLKYIVYAVLPTVIGGAAGGYIGMNLFPQLIIDAYSMLYSIPSPDTPMHNGLWAQGLLMGLAATGLAATVACVNELRENPSSLLRPKAPKAGKRNLIEFIPFVWMLLNFIQKVTVRNLLRYKKRLFMTVIGISGCTALLLTGYGVRDSIAGITDIQFGEVNHYNMSVTFADSAAGQDITRASDILEASPLYRRGLTARQKTMDASEADGGKVYQATVIIPETADDLEHFFTFRDRETHAEYTLNENGVIITEKLSRLLEIAPGDRMTLRDGDGPYVTVPVAAVMETYFLHYVYMTAETYQAVFGEAPEYNTIFSVVDDESAHETDALAAVLLDERGVSGVSFIKSMIGNFSDIISNLDFVVYVLIASAGALALVVLLNLTNININERVRELATIEVLGFYDSEVSAYIYRENAILTILGAGAGLLLGMSLHLYVIITVETDIMMFGREIKTASYLLSVALTFLFALAVNLMTANKLKKINMVEALKSAE
ncbi:MAG: ABC transporter permease [Clostridiales bacterium]|jgi:putative ABC transport system permease protein|nr:ABC transporter permease [Clostridiales bacterium]